MKKITLYRFFRPDGGGVTTSTVRPDDAYTELFRLIADEGYVLTDGATVTTVVDTEDSTTWTEIPDAVDPYEIEQKARAYDIIAGVV